MSFLWKLIIPRDVPPCLVLPQEFTSCAYIAISCHPAQGTRAPFWANSYLLPSNANHSWIKMSEIHTENIVSVVRPCVRATRSLCVCVSGFIAVFCLNFLEHHSWNGALYRSIPGPSVSCSAAELGLEQILELGARSPDPAYVSKVLSGQHSPGRLWSCRETTSVWIVNLGLWYFWGSWAADASLLHWQPH